MKFKKKYFTENKNKNKTRKLNQCNFKKLKTKNNNLLEYYYLYDLIKYVQSYLNTTKYDGKSYANFFGNLSNEEIIEIFK